MFPESKGAGEREVGRKGDWIGCINKEREKERPGEASVWKKRESWKVGSKCEKGECVKEVSVEGKGEKGVFEASRSITLSFKGSLRNFSFGVYCLGKRMCVVRKAGGGGGRRKGVKMPRGQFIIHGG